MKFLILTILWISNASASVLRRKRIVNGVIIVDRKEPAYLSINYFAWIGLGRDLTDWLLLRNEWKGERRVCGGALLTTSAVQSACHCFAMFESPDRNGIHRAVRHQYTMQVVVGHSKVEREVNPLFVKDYFLHPQCGHLLNDEALLLYDFGLLVLRNELKLSATVTLAPVYPLTELTRMWRRFISNRHICLFVGFGRYISRQDKTVPLELRHTWQVILEYRACYKLYIRDGPFLNMTEYQNLATTNCFDPLDSLAGTTATGDSGSPITCDNHYFAFVASTAGGTVWTIFATDVMYDPFANSREYRLALIKALADPDHTAHKHHTFHPDYLIGPGTPPVNYFSAGYNTARQTSVFFLFRLLIVLSTGKIFC